MIFQLGFRSEKDIPIGEVYLRLPETTETLQRTLHTIYPKTKDEARNSSVENDKLVNGLSSIDEKDEDSGVQWKSKRW